MFTNHLNCSYKILRQIITEKGQSNRCKPFDRISVCNWVEWILQSRKKSQKVTLEGGGAAKKVMPLTQNLSVSFLSATQVFIFCISWESGNIIVRENKNTSKKLSVYLSYNIRSIDSYFADFVMLVNTCVSKCKGECIHRSKL